MEVASGCVHAGCEVTLVSDGKPLARQLGDHLADIFTSAAIRRGLRVVGGGKARLVDHGAGAKVVLANGTALEADLVVTAIGDEPNIGWLAGSNLLIDGRCGSIPAAGSGRTSSPPAMWRPSRPAAGWNGCPCGPAPSTRPGSPASACLKGDAAPEFDFQPYFWTEGFGLSLKSAGFAPAVGPPDYCEPGGAEDSMLLRWDNTDGSGTAAALNYRIPVPKLRRFADAGPAALRAAAPART